MTRPAGEPRRAPAEVTARTASVGATSLDPRSQTLLEYPLVRARLAAETGFPPGRRVAEALEPSADRVIVARGLEETSQTRSFVAEHPGAGIGGSKDILPWTERAVRGGRLEPRHFLDIAETLEAAARLGEALSGDRRLLLRDLARELHPQPSLRNTLNRSFDPTGEMADTASPRLGGLRRAVRIAYDRLRTRLDQLVHSGEFASALQEPIVTLRGGRYVIPVRADARSRVKGIVHDASGSGQTLFVEPIVAIELGNAWREAQLAAVAEEERILDELSALVAGQAPQLRETLDALARFDFWAAKARLAEEMDAIPAEMANRAEIVLLGARHPGLSGHVVPIDIRLGGEYTALLITGPNTGGKTVALRTLGLLSLMHQAGLHVPADTGTSLPILRNVLADIGDEQSVAQSLSTFSGHLRSIVRIVEAAGPGTLVLLDELGAGTDPTEGSALAQALLDHFIKAGALVAATTHYAELKLYAHTTPAARNASVEFDVETLRPTFRLSIGLPGRSQAFAIAERLGLSSSIVDDARSRLTEEQQAFEETLASIKATETQTTEALAQARLAEDRARVALAAADEERRKARRERDESLKAARDEAERVVDDVRAEVRGIRRQLERETITQRSLDEGIERARAHVERLPAPEPEPTRAAPAVPVAWHMGMRARNTSAGWEGRIVALEKGGKRATLEAGGMRVTVPVADLEPATGGDGESSPGTSSAGGRSRGLSAPSGGAASQLQLERARTVASSLDLRGAKVQEALEALDRYLDDASLAGLDQAIVIHGMGTGALRDAVRDHASAHPLVKSWRAGGRGEGGDGATVVSF
ncbi:MAG TPA: endonuclease MutS2 [Candidatus Limnocylindrales bacterium]